MATNRTGHRSRIMTARPLSSHFGGSQVTKSYSHSPLVGVTPITPRLNTSISTAGSAHHDQAKLLIRLRTGVANYGLIGRLQRFAARLPGYEKPTKVQ